MIPGPDGGSGTCREGGEGLCDMNIVLGITGGIAAYKAASLASKLKGYGTNVNVIMTANATQFIAPLTLQTLSRNPVRVGMFDPGRKMEHVSLADEADLILVAPATANIIGKVAAGIADDMLSTVIMAVGGRVPVVFAPAMNKHMYENPIVQGNIRRLRELGYYFVGPDAGRLAEGYEGMGRLASEDEIIRFVVELSANQGGGPRGKLIGKRVIVTSGPTRGAIDAVRYISNKSTGQLGTAIAMEALREGAEVTFVQGKGSLCPERERPEPEELTSAREQGSAGRLRVIEVETVDDIIRVLKGELGSGSYDVVFHAMAVLDYVPAEVESGKTRSDRDEWVVRLVRTPKVIKMIKELAPRVFLVGFKLEVGKTGEELVAQATEALLASGADMFLANDLTEIEKGNHVGYLVRPGGNVEWVETGKGRIARRLVESVVETTGLNA